MATSARQASSIADENKRGLQKAPPAGTKAAFGTSTTRGAGAGGHRRALSELGNIVAASAAGADGLRTEKENATKVQASQIVTRGAARRSAAAPKPAVTKALAEVKPKVVPTRAGAKAETEQTIQGEDAAVTSRPLSSHPSRVPAVPKEIPRSHSTGTMSSSLTAETGSQAGILPLPASSSFTSTSVLSIPAEGCSLSSSEREAENENDPKRMSMTASLAAYSEEACGAEMMDAEECVPDIDAEDRNNPLAVTQYVEDIYAFYRRAESQSMVSSEYMSQQTDINDKMRGILVDWLVEVHYKFKLLPETLYLTTNLIDRYLAITPMSRKNLQLVGVTAMLVASKYEEIWAPEVKDFVYISDNAYSKDQILNMEKHMLNKLRFNLTVPTPYVFAARFLKAACTAADKTVQHLTWFLLELCLPDYQMISFSPSLLAAAAVYTALSTSTSASSPTSFSSATSSFSSSSALCDATSRWTPSLRKHSGYSEKELIPCAELIAGLQRRAAEGNLTAVHKKYSSTKFLQVAHLPHAVLPTVC